SEAYLSQNYSPSHHDYSYAQYNFFWETLRQYKGDSKRAEKGSNFIDCSLQIRVLGAEDSVVVFRPYHVHGTTLADPALTRQ
ncbi:hypothetical protein M422DRAFT_785498, partial [Sphaerobolus stellatus SS14]